MFLAYTALWFLKARIADANGLSKNKIHAARADLYLLRISAILNPVIVIAVCKFKIILN